MSELLRRISRGWVARWGVVASGVLVFQTSCHEKPVPVKQPQVQRLCSQPSDQGQFVCDRVPLDLRPFSVIKEQPKLDPNFASQMAAGVLVETDKQVFDLVSRRKDVQPVYLPLKHGGLLGSVAETAFVPVNKDPKTGQVFARPKLIEFQGLRRPGEGFFVDDIRYSFEGLTSKLSEFRDVFGSVYFGGVQPRLAVTRSRKWSNANVCYRYQSGVPSDLRRSIEDVFADVERNTPLRFFYGDAACEGHALDIHYPLDDEDLCGWADIGMGRGGRQELHLRCTSAHTISHELFHTLGTPHEQSRPDRGDYVLWVRENTKPDHRGQFDIDASSDAIGPYNWRSVTHYRGNAFSSGGPTLLRCPRDLPLRSCAGDDGRPLWLTTDGLGGDYPNELDWSALSSAYCDGTAPADRCRGSWPNPPGTRLAVRLRDLIDSYYERPYTPSDERELPIILPPSPAGTSFELAEWHGVPVLHYGREFSQVQRAFPYSEFVDDVDSDSGTANRRLVGRVYDPESRTYRTEDYSSIAALCVGIKLSDGTPFTFDEPAAPCFPHDPRATSLAPGATDVRQPGHQYYRLGLNRARHFLIPSYSPPAVGSHQLIIELDIWGYGAHEGSTTPYAPDSYIWGVHEFSRRIAVSSSNGAYLSGYPSDVWMNYVESEAPSGPVGWRGGVVQTGLCSASDLVSANNRRRFVVSQRGTGPVNVRSVRIAGSSPSSFRVRCFSAVPDVGFPFAIDAAADIRALGVVEFMPPVAQPIFGEPSDSDADEAPWFSGGYPEAPWGFFGNVELAQIEIEGDTGHTLIIPLQGYVW